MESVASSTNGRQGFASRGAAGAASRPGSAARLPPAVVMAGGYGTRLGDLTKALPKPMVPVAGRPALDHVVDGLARRGVPKAAFALHYLPDAIRDHFGPGRRDLPLDYYVAPEDRGTAGGAKRAAALLDGDSFFVVSGDVLCDADLGAVWREHVERRARFTIVLVRVADARQYGVAVADRLGRISKFVEKPAVSPPGGAWVNAGIYLADRSVMDLVPDDAPFDFSRNLFPAMMARGIPIHGSFHRGHWFDIGTPESLAEARDFHAGRDIAD